MKASLRAKRMARQHQRLSKQSKLNLTSLMDIFTILVFFLMVNSSDVQILENTKSITMPVSNADQKPKETLVLQVNDTDVVLAGLSIIKTSEILSSKDDLVLPLSKELEYQSSKRLQLTEEEKQLGRAITIQGDKDIQYEVLKKLMATCAKAGYRNISLAVSKATAKKTTREG